MKARAKADDKDFRILEYVGVEDVKIMGPSGRMYHFGEDPEEIKVAIHLTDINYLRAVGLIRKIGDDGPSRTATNKVDIKDGMIVACGEYGIWVIDGDKRRHVPDVATQLKMGLSWEYIINLPPDEFKVIPKGPPLPKIPLRKSGGTHRKPVIM